MEKLVYNGAFFRSVGGDAAEFEVLQSEGLPDIQGAFCSASSDYMNTRLIHGKNNDFFGHAIKSWYGEGAETTPSVKQTVTVNIKNHITVFKASYDNPLYGKNAHVTPVNYSIQIWIRES